MPRRRTRRRRRSRHRPVHRRNRHPPTRGTPHRRPDRCAVYQPTALGASRERPGGTVRGDRAIVTIDPSTLLHRLSATVSIQVGRRVAGIDRVDAHARICLGVHGRHHVQRGLRGRVREPDERRLEPARIGGDREATPCRWTRSRSPVPHCSAGVAGTPVSRGRRRTHSWRTALCMSSAVVSPAGRNPVPAIPALLTRTSRWPTSASISLAAACTESSLVTSSGTYRPPTAAAAARPRSASRAPT